MRKSLCIVLILLICFVTTFTYAEEENENNTVDLQQQRSDLQNQLNEANGQLNDVQSNLSENLQQIEKLDNKIEASEEKLAEQESKITELKNSISKIEEELNTTTEKYEKQKKLFQQRLVATYEAGETQYLDILLKSKSLSDFLSSYYIITELEKLSDDEKNLQAKIDEINKQYAEVNNQILALAEQGIETAYIGGELEWPVPGYTRITSKYAMRVHPITGQYKLHTGVDIGAPEGANFIAANDGVVVKAERNAAYGNMVIIDHGGGISTLYAHGSEILVELGQTVKRGDAVLKVGSTGYSTGPHAHFEVRINGVTTDPLPYITNGLIPGTENTTDDTTNEIN